MAWERGPHRPCPHPWAQQSPLPPSPLREVKSHWFGTEYPKRVLQQHCWALSSNAVRWSQLRVPSVPRSGWVGCPHHAGVFRSKGGLPSLGCAGRFLWGWEKAGVGAPYPVTKDSQVADICGRPQSMRLPVCCRSAVLGSLKMEQISPLVLPPPWVLEASLFPGECWLPFSYRSP